MAGETVIGVAWHEQAQQMDAQPTSPSTGPVRVGITSMADRDLQHTTDGDLWRDSVQHHHLATTTSEPGAAQTLRVLLHTRGRI